MYSLSGMIHEECAKGSQRSCAGKECGAMSSARLVRREKAKAETRESRLLPRPAVERGEEGEEGSRRQEGKESVRKKARDGWID